MPKNNTTSSITIFLLSIVAGFVLAFLYYNINYDRLVLTDTDSYLSKNNLTMYCNKGSDPLLSSQEHELNNNFPPIYGVNNIHKEKSKGSNKTTTITTKALKVVYSPKINALINPKTPLSYSDHSFGKMNDVKGWVLNIFSVESKEKAESKLKYLTEKYNEKKYEFDFVKVNIKGKHWYRVRLIYIKTRSDALKLQKSINYNIKAKDAWIQHLNLSIP